MAAWMEWMMTSSMGGAFAAIFAGRGLA